MHPIIYIHLLLYQAQSKGLRVNQIQSPTKIWGKTNRRYARAFTHQFLVVSIVLYIYIYIYIYFNKTGRGFLLCFYYQ
jgi:hypothetical protein